MVAIALIALILPVSGAGVIAQIVVGALVTAWRFMLVPASLVDGQKTAELLNQLADVEGPGKAHADAAIRSFKVKGGLTERELSKYQNALAAIEADVACIALPPLFSHERTGEAERPT